MLFKPSRFGVMVCFNPKRTCMKPQSALNHTLFLLLFTYAANAQTDSTQPAKPQLKISLNYNSALNYYGRTDSLRSGGVFPMIEFWAAKNFYVNAAPVFVNNAVANPAYAGTVATAGYQRVSDKWLTHIYVTKPFYKADAELVQSALKAQAGMSFTRLNKVLNVTAGGDAKFSDQIDFGATAGLDRIIRIENKNGSVWVIDPSAYVYAGTQRFTQTYQQKKKSNFPLLPDNDQTVTESVQKFNVLACEFSIPVIYVRGKLQLMATPAYVLPQNLIQVTGRPDLSEQGQNTFYVTAGVKLTF